MFCLTRISFYPKASTAELTVTLRGIQWVREDLSPQYVTLYLDGKFITENQHPWYKDRGYIHPNGSMLILYPQLNDTGLYICYLVYRGADQTLWYIENERLNVTVLDD